MRWRAMLVVIELSIVIAMIGNFIGGGVRIT
jgi:hypothetical protein